jgi:DNA-binding response OmpR family regulator
MKQVLVVDDDSDILDALQFVLEDSGYAVTISQKGEYAENLMKERNLPDMLILDVLLSGMDGREICHKLKQNRSTQSLPILMISAHLSSDKSIQDCGADAFLPKPFNINTLLQTIEHYVPNT